MGTVRSGPSVPPVLSFQGRYFFNVEIVRRGSWCRLPGSNWAPTDYKSVALPNELRRHCYYLILASSILTRLNIFALSFGRLDFSNIVFNCSKFYGPNLVFPFFVSIGLAILTFLPPAPFAMLVSSLNYWWR